jgi:hypothetical protein
LACAEDKSSAEPLTDPVAVSWEGAESNVIMRSSRRPVINLRVWTIERWMFHEYR